MYAEILSNYLSDRSQTLAEPAVLSVKVDGINYESTEWSTDRICLNGASDAFRGAS